MPKENNPIQWFPGHMAKTRRLIGETLPLVDLVAEITDARIPLSSRNPELGEWVKNKPRIILLNKCDMADSAITEKWIKALNNETTVTLPIDCKSGSGFNRFLPQVRSVLKPVLERYREKGIPGKPLRIMAVGVPNVGKSSFINRLAGNNRAKVENRPGVTRGNQWFMIDKGVELLDTPGVLWPKFDDKATGEHIAYCGSIKDSILDVETLAIGLAELLKEKYPELLAQRYKLPPDFVDSDGYGILELIGKNRGMKAHGGDVDTERAASTLLEEFRNAKLGRISLESPEDMICPIMK